MPRRFLSLIVFCEFLASIGVILRAATGVLPWLTPLAGLGLAVMLLLTAGFHLTRGEYSNSVSNVFLLVLAAFVAYGRFRVAPL